MNRRQENMVLLVMAYTAEPEAGVIRTAMPGRAAQLSDPLRQPKFNLWDERALALFYKNGVIVSELWAD